mmetsp:Transcript_13691/g.22821  ORF Transcript_13691/g.22821 Transcript_13691/m.22821 type:complete len:210 (+) Transcript_13691:1-630(+)
MMKMMMTTTMMMIMMMIYFGLVRKKVLMIIVIVVVVQSVDIRYRREDIPTYLHSQTNISSSAMVDCSKVNALHTTPEVLLLRQILPMLTSPRRVTNGLYFEVENVYFLLLLVLVSSVMRFNHSIQLLHCCTIALLHCYTVPSSIWYVSVVSGRGGDGISCQCRASGPWTAYCGLAQPRALCPPCPIPAPAPVQSHEQRDQQRERVCHNA